MPLWLQALLGAMTLLIAGIGAVIAWQQRKLAERTLVHHLFDRRWAVYAAINDILASHITGDEEHQRFAGQEFARRKVDGVFLFPPVVVSFLKEADDAVAAARGADRALRKAPQGHEAVLSNQRRYTAAVAELRALHERLPSVFRSSLDLTQ